MGDSYSHLHWITVPGIAQLFGRIQRTMKVVSIDWLVENSLRSCPRSPVASGLLP